MPALLIAGLAVAAAAAAAKTAHGADQNKQGNKINPVYNPYQGNKAAYNQLGTAQQLFNGRMAGAQSQEQNIAANQAQTIANVNQNATDSGQALQLGMLAQGQSNDAYSKLATEESQNKYGLLGNLNQGYQALIGEGDKQFKAMEDKYVMDLKRKDALKNAGWANILGGLKDLSGVAMMGAQARGGTSTGAV